MSFCIHFATIFGAWARRSRPQTYNWIQDRSPRMLIQNGLRNSSPRCHLSLVYANYHPHSTARIVLCFCNNNRLKFGLSEMFALWPFEIRDKQCVRTIRDVQLLHVTFRQLERVFCYVFCTKLILINLFRAFNT